MRHEMKKVENRWLKRYFTTMLEGGFKEESCQQKAQKCEKCGTELQKVH